MSAPAKFAIRKSVRVFEAAGVVESLDVSAYADGRPYVEARFAGGSVMTLPMPREAGGTYDYPIDIAEGSAIAVRSILVPAVDNVRGSATYGTVVQSKRYLFAEGDDLSVLPTEADYLASDYPGKPQAAQTAASVASVSDKPF